MAEEVFDRILRKIDDGMRYLLRLSVEWRKHEINVISLIASRVADRLVKRLSELEYDVKRVWRPKIVTKRWGLEVPEVEKPMIRLIYPGTKYLGGPEESKWYDTVVMPSMENYPQQEVVKLPRVPFYDMMVTDRELYTHQFSAMGVLVHSVELTLDMEPGMYRWICGNCSLTEKNVGGRLVLSVTPIAFGNKALWNDPKCMGGKDSSECYKVPPMETDAPTGKLAIIDVERVAFGVANIYVARLTDGAEELVANGRIYVSAVKVVNSQYIGPWGTVDVNINNVGVVILVDISTWKPLLNASVITTIGEEPFVLPTMTGVPSRVLAGLLCIGLSGKTFCTVFEPVT